MVTPLSPAVRRKIIAFDPADPDAVTVSEFCKTLKISRRSFYTIRSRYAEESQAALHPRSSAPHTTQRIYDESITRVLLAARADLKSRGWDYGPMSIRFEIAIEELLVPPIPSVSTIARLLRAAGAVEANPKKRPKSSYVRFQRDQAMALWQIDAFEYKLFDHHRSKVTIYQVIDDATRKDMGTTAFADPENAEDAMTVMRACVTAYGAPHEVLSDNHSSFNQLRQGRVGAMEVYLASVGSLAISGRTYHPQTQGKNERSHQTLYRYLQAHRPAHLEEVKALLVSYRQHYNHRRPHQALPPNMTPQMVWEIIDHAPPQAPLDPAVLAHKAAVYAQRKADMAQMVRHAETSARPKRLAATDPPIEPDSDDEHPDPQVVAVTPTNRAVFFQGRKIGLPINYANRQLYRTVTGDELAYWCVIEGDMVLSIPLPIVAMTGSKKFVNSYNIQGVWLQEPPPLWIKRREEALKKFQALTPADSSGN